MNRLYPLLTVLLIALTSCGKSYHIKGTSDVSRIDGKMIYLKSGGDDGWTVLDSSEIIHGAFSMKGKLDSVQLISIVMNNENYMPMVLEDGVIEIAITRTGFQVKGTPLNEKLYAFITEKGILDEQIGEAARYESRLIMDGADPELAQQQAFRKAAGATEKVRLLTKAFIEENYENILGPSVFLMVCGSSFPYPMLTPDLQVLHDNAPASFREDKNVKEYVEKALENIAFLKEVKRHQDAPDSPVRSSIPLPDHGQ